MKNRLLFLGYALLVLLCTLGTAIGINHWFFNEGFNRELSAALGLLLLNYGFYLGFTQAHSPKTQSMGASFGLLLIAAKLFVNTFTIFLFIGLQAVRTHVFVSEFLAAYSVLLLSGVAFLHWNSKRF